MAFPATSPPPPSAGACVIAGGAGRGREEPAGRVGRREAEKPAGRRWGHRGRSEGEPRAARRQRRGRSGRCEDEPAPAVASWQGRRGGGRACPAQAENKAVALLAGGGAGGDEEEKELLVGGAGRDGKKEDKGPARLKLPLLLLGVGSVNVEPTGPVGTPNPPPLVVSACTEGT